MGNYTIYTKKFYKCSENSRSQITDIFRKLTLGAPDLSLDVLSQNAI